MSGKRLISFVQNGAMLQVLLMLVALFNMLTTAQGMAKIIENSWSRQNIENTPLMEYILFVAANVCLLLGALLCRWILIVIWILVYLFILLFRLGQIMSVATKVLLSGYQYSNDEVIKINKVQDDLGIHCLSLLTVAVGLIVLFLIKSRQRGFIEDNPLTINQFRDKGCTLSLKKDKNSNSVMEQLAKPPTYDELLLHPPPPPFEQFYYVVVA